MKKKSVKENMFWNMFWNHSNGLLPSHGLGPVCTLPCDKLEIERDAPFLSSFSLQNINIWEYEIV